MPKNFCSQLVSQLSLQIVSVCQMLMLVFDVSMNSVLIVMI